MMNTKIAEVQRLLIDFARLSGLQRNHFLETLNHYMYASPQRRRKILLEWEAGREDSSMDQANS